jgi:hypothetical protein
MASNQQRASYITSEFILSYPKLDKPDYYHEMINGERVRKGDKLQYDMEALSTPESLKQWRLINKETYEASEEYHDIEKACVQMARAAFEEDLGEDFSVAEVVKMGAMKWPFHSGDRKADAKAGKAEIYRGKKYWRAKAMAEIKGQVAAPRLLLAPKPGETGLLELHRGTLQGDQAIAQHFYPGAFCTAEVTAQASDTGGNRYVTFYLNSIVFERHGERMSSGAGGGSAMERMRGVRGGTTDLDPTVGMEPAGADLDDEVPF